MTGSFLYCTRFHAAENVAKTKKVPHDVVKFCITKPLTDAVVSIFRAETIARDAA